MLLLSLSAHRVMLYGHLHVSWVALGHGRCSWGGVGGPLWLFMGAGGHGGPSSSLVVVMGCCVGSSLLIMCAGHVVVPRCCQVMVVLCHCCRIVVIVPCCCCWVVVVMWRCPVVSTKERREGDALTHLMWTATMLCIFTIDVEKGRGRGW